ncbi:MAG: IMP dehydrogenase [Candidatus Diapherotrites archaeon]|nr:IMP dehydrogenase [Candidatus Diapherotrites archaeon]
MLRALTFDDVLLLPQKSDILPKDVSLRTKLTNNLELNIPLITAAMDTVTEAKTAIAIAKQGGIGIIHKNMSIEAQAEQVAKVKRSEALIVENPVTVAPNQTLADLWFIKKSQGISSFPVVQNGKLVGLVTNRDIRFESNGLKKVSEMMTKDLVTVNKKVGASEAIEILRKNKVEKLPIVDKQGKLQGLITSTDILKKQKYPNTLTDHQGKLRVGAAIGPKDFDRIEKLISAGVDVIVLDTAHGHSLNVINGIKKIKKEFQIELIAGNVGTAQGAKDLLNAGADAIKVGIGPGVICTTRIITGCGVPQLSAVQACVKAVGEDIPVISDGGIRYSGDIVKALAAGASSVMIGSLFAGCDETPGKLIYLNNRKFKQYRGMGSLGAMIEGSKDRYMQADVMDKDKLVPEGVEGIVPFKGTVAEVCFQLLGGLKAGMGMQGAKNIAVLQKNAEFIELTFAGLKESHPHDIKITEEAPNYS